MSNFLVSLASVSLIIFLMSSISGCVKDQQLAKELSSITPGVLAHHYLKSDSQQEYYIYIPRSGSKNTATFVTVHGISRNALEHARSFVPYAEYYGVTLIAPLFPKSRFPNYQQMGGTRQEQRADIALNEIINEVGKLTQANTNKLYLFGFSGGAQFVHRYMMAYPERVEKIVVGAAGWYTFPDSAHQFPLGIKPAQDLADLHFDPEKFLMVPAFVLVGEKDTESDGALHTSIELSRLQGETRLERGRSWIVAMENIARRHNFGTRYGFFILPHCNHSFTRCVEQGNMAELTFHLLFDH